MSEARIARLGSVDSGGRPHIVPITFGLSGDMLYSAVDSKPKRSRKLKRLRNIEANPTVAVLVDAYDDDWSRLWWCRADGRAQVVHGGESFEDALGVLAAKYAQYRDEPPAGPVVAVTVTSWTGWTAR